MKWLLSLLLGVLVSGQSFASDSAVPLPVDSQAPVKRVGGDYKVTKIQKQNDGHFRIDFESKVKSGRYDHLFLVSDHVNISVQEGSMLRLSAEVMEDSKTAAEVSQVLLFIPYGETHVPVWMMSARAKNQELKSSKYIEMHAPTSDYLIF